MRNLVLRTLYAVHMLAPASLVAWHVTRLRPETLRGLLELFRA